MSAMIEKKIALDVQRLRLVCERWKVQQLSLFGSVVTDHFRPDSDIDALVTFASPVQWSLFDAVEFHRELERLFRRPVDLVSQDSVRTMRNAERRDEILKTAQVIYVARQ